uniref:Uncharacterized protein n=1 Tax=Anguilla anguilla TaxID=7936 RepID=A0A0E9QAX5_ANGAN
MITKQYNSGLGLVCLKWWGWGEESKDLAFSFK